MILDFIAGIFSPVAELIDNVHTSDFESGTLKNRQAELKNKMAEIESKVVIRMFDLQNAAMEANAKIAVQEQVSGSVISKNWRPVASIMFTLLLAGMGLDIIVFKPLLAQIAGGFLGIYGIGRSVEKAGK